MLYCFLLKKKKNLNHAELVIGAVFLCAGENGVVEKKEEEEKSVLREVYSSDL